MLSRIDPKVDFAFKWLFGREKNLPLLVHLLNAVLKPPAGAEIVSLELLNPFNEQDAANDKLSIVDVKARDLSGRQFDIEMQLLAERVFSKRILYYWADLHEQQLKEGEFYDRLRPTISICITNFSLFPETSDYCLVFELLNKEHGIVFSSDIKVITLELSKFKLEPNDISSPLDAWLYFLCKGEELDSEHLPPALNRPEICNALEELNMLSHDDLERERYKARVRVQRDEQSRLHSWREEGLEEGRAEGLQKGLAEGLEKGLEKGREDGLKKGKADSIHLCQDLLKQTRTPLEKLSLLSIDELQVKVDELKGELLK